jgi:hypothetical protein
MSRVSPMNVHTVFTSHEKSLLHSGQRMAVCLSPILVVESHLLTPTDKGLFNKFIKGKLHEQEMQRLVGATCMAFGQSVLHAQIERDNMIFATNGNWKSGKRFKCPSGVGTDVQHTVSEAKTGTPSAMRYIRSPALLAKAQQKGRGQFTKQMLDVADTGAR